MISISQVKIDKLVKVAVEFGQIAQKVNESSKLRKKQAELAISSVDPAFKVCEELLKIFQTNSKMGKDYVDIIKSLEKTVGELLKDITKAKGALKKVKPSPGQKNYTKAITDLEVSSKKAMEIIKKLTQDNSEIVKMYDLIIKSKLAQKRNIMQLQVITEVVEQEAQKAIEGSQSNLKRGQQLSKNFQSVPKLIKDKNIEELNNLVVEAHAGWTLAAEVNKNSKSQLSFNQNFNSFSKKLHADSRSSEKKVLEKHETMKKSAQKMADLAKILSQKIAIFNKAVQKSKSVLNENKNLQETHTKVAEKVKMISGIKLFEAKYKDTNNKLKLLTSTLTKKEIEYFNNLKNSVHTMTESTKFPIQGSGKNITNGKFLETTLKEIIAQIS
jgi:hypothetical protein